MKLIVRLLVLSLLVGLVIFLGHYISTHNMGIFNPKGIIALAEMNLMITATLLMLIVVIPVFIMLGAFAYWYREGNKKAKYTPDWHSNTLLEVIWWTIPAVIVIILAVITWKSSHDLDPFKPLDSAISPIVIEVVALDWKWLFIYPEENIATVNFVQIPEGVPVQFKITSDTAMNAFWIPQLGSMIYAMAGMTAKLHLMGTEVGDYNGLSSNFSGDGFSGMKFTTRVSTWNEYKEWAQMVRYSPEALTLSRYEELAKKSMNHPVEYYASFEQGLYNKIIMKYMPDMKETHIMPNGETMHH